jgi:AcrR family transcriptional regulator
VVIERADAARNRQAILDAAESLFSQEPGPDAVSMDQIAQAAGVGKGTLFRRFGGRAELVRALFATRASNLREQIVSGEPPLGPATSPATRVKAILDEIVVLKLENVNLMSALERSSPRTPQDLFNTPDYGDIHLLFTDLIRQCSPSVDASWAAHVLLGAVRADLLRHLVHGEGLTGPEIQSRVRLLADRLLVD